MSAGPIFSQLNPGDRGRRHGTAPRWPDRLARQARELAHGAWKRAFGEEEPAALGENVRYRTGFLAFQRWSPFIVPPLLGGLLLTLTLVLYAHGIYASNSPVAALGPTLLVFVALVCGAFLVWMLVLAPNDALWLGALVAGSVLYPVFMLSAEFSLAIGMLPVLLVAGLSAHYAYRHQCEVPEGCIVLTARKGSYLRTLYPGKNLLWPGERMLGTLETGQRIYISPTLKTQVRASDGTQYRASASAIVAFAFIPAEARGVARGFDTWERDLHQLIAVALREALQQWSTHKIASAELAPAGLVARWVLDEVRGWARASGIWISWVRVCHLQLGPAWEDLEQTPDPRSASHPSRAGQGRPVTGATG
ncbi:MAG TPA: SPFH domain-containing protein, partial [Ktedonobacterales bacterium]